MLNIVKKIPKKKLNFFNVTQIEYEFLNVKNIKIHILLKKFNFVLGEILHEFALKDGSKMKMEKFLETKS